MPLKGCSLLMIPCQASDFIWITREGHNLTRGIGDSNEMASDLACPLCQVTSQESSDLIEGLKLAMMVRVYNTPSKLSNLADFPNLA